MKAAIYARVSTRNRTDRATRNVSHHNVDFQTIATTTSCGLRFQNDAGRDNSAKSFRIAWNGLHTMYYLTRA